MAYTRIDQYDEEIKDMYINQMLSTVKIAEHFGCSARTIGLKLERMGIKRRSLIEAQYASTGRHEPQEFQSYETMYELYVEQKLNKDELGKRFGVSPSCVGRALMRLGIPVRGTSEAQRGMRNGDKHPNWKGGITPLTLRIREYYQLHLAPIIRERDGYKCQLCGNNSNLHTHHIRHLSDIINEILEEHADLDPVDDINILYNIIIRDSRFLDLDNLITYCSDCHINIHKSQLAAKSHNEKRSTTIPKGSTSQAIGDGNGGAPLGA